MSSMYRWSQDSPYGADRSVPTVEAASLRIESGSAASPPFDVPSAPSQPTQASSPLTTTSTSSAPTSTTHPTTTKSTSTPSSGSQCKRLRAALLTKKIQTALQCRCEDCCGGEDNKDHECTDSKLYCVVYRVSNHELQDVGLFKWKQADITAQPEWDVFMKYLQRQQGSGRESKRDFNFDPTAVQKRSLPSDGLSSLSSPPFHPLRSLAGNAPTASGSAPGSSPPSAHSGTAPAVPRPNMHGAVEHATSSPPSAVTSSDSESAHIDNPFATRTRLSHSPPPTQSSGKAQPPTQGNTHMAHTHLSVTPSRSPSPSTRPKRVAKRRGWKSIGGDTQLVIDRERDRSNEGGSGRSERQSTARTAQTRRTPPNRRHAQTSRKSWRNRRTVAGGEGSRLAQLASRGTDGGYTSYRNLRGFEDDIEAASRLSTAVRVLRDSVQKPTRSQSTMPGASRSVRVPPWKETFAAIDAVRQVLRFHPNVLLTPSGHSGNPPLRAVYTALMHHTSNLRSSLARNALIAMSELPLGVGKSLDRHAKFFLPGLCRRAGDTTKQILADAASQAVYNCTAYCSPLRIVQLLVASVSGTDGGNSGSSPGFVGTGSPGNSNNNSNELVEQAMRHIGLGLAFIGRDISLTRQFFEDGTPLAHECMVAACALLYHRRKGVREQGKNVIGSVVRLALTLGLHRRSASDDNEESGVPDSSVRLLRDACKNVDRDYQERLKQVLGDFLRHFELGGLRNVGAHVSSAAQEERMHRESLLLYGQKHNGDDSPAEQEQKRTQVRPRSGGARDTLALTEGGGSGGQGDRGNARLVGDPLASTWHGRGVTLPSTTLPSASPLTNTTTNSGEANEFFQSITGSDGGSI